MTAIIDIGTLIVRTPETCGDRPRIAGTKVSVQRIVVWHKRGLTPEEIGYRFGHLNLAQIHAALAYYYANQNEIEEYLVAEEADYHRFEAEHKAGI
ncbi:MAG: DUF433 domain-containing protein [Okeania sp. SIO3I5]|uniref:DUF433 domain-containing protein n=1 Tax=Okeania sp. SIO3I5 TaxID=2607805 RepID=UPI0013BD60F9|nr:DUF433 domain-containing protein [Okeania sp. SIO3I5]NEQ39121.1 DUF433 domain-containing protein [Okeania sp. SIO3I5]